MFKNIKNIASKLILVFILVAIISSLSGVVGAALLKQADTDYSNALVDYGFAQGDIGRLGMLINENRAYIRDLVFLEDLALMRDANEKIEENAKETMALLDKIRPSNKSKEAIDLFEELEKTINEYSPIRKEVGRLGLTNEEEKAYDLWINKGSPMINKVVEQAEKLLDMNIDAGEKISKSLTEQSNVGMIIAIAAIVAGLIVSIIIALAMAASIAKPVKLVKESAEKLANGNLDIYINSNQSDEIGQMTNSFAQAATMMRETIGDLIRGFIEIEKGNFDVKPNVIFKGEFKKIEASMIGITVALSNTLGQINQASEQVAAGSDQVSSGAQALSQGATEQASSIEELSATIAEVSGQIRQNAENAQAAKSQSEKASNEVQGSNDQMQAMIAAMNDISEKSSEIGKIIKTIDDIAFQTNILALNAAVEAARAGSAGKGFAVVADEVRNLAQKSADAAKNTTALIEETVQAVANGTHIADGTAQAMLIVVQGVEQVTGLVNEIAKASGEQAAAITQVTMGVDQISSVVQTNSATSEESAAASEELSSQAQMLKDLVSQFKLLNNGGNHISPAKSETTDLSFKNSHTESKY